MCIRDSQDPSLNQSVGYRQRLNDQTIDNTIVIIQNYYFKNIRKEVLEEESTNTTKYNNEISYIRAKVNGVATKLMIDTGANVSLSDSTDYNKIQKESKLILLPVSYTHLDVYKRQDLGRACIIECDTFVELERIIRRSTGSKNKLFTLSYIDVSIITLQKVAHL